MPDHGKLGPWRFLCFQDQARQHFGDQLAQRFATLKPEAPDAAVAAERARFMRAPLVIAVISCVQEHPKIPQWEQFMSAGGGVSKSIGRRKLNGFCRPVAD